MNRFSKIVKHLRGEPVKPRGLAPRPSLTEDDIGQIEHLLGVSLPEDYREFMRDYALYKFPYGAIFTYVSIDGMSNSANAEVFYGLMPGDDIYDLVENYLWLINDTERVWPKDLLPIAHDAGESQICLVIRGPKTGQIYFVSDSYTISDDTTHFVASTFSEFMQLLRNDLP